MSFLVSTLALAPLLASFPDAWAAIAMAPRPASPTERIDDEALLAGAIDVISRRCAPCHAPDSGDEKALKNWNCADDLVATLAMEHMIEPGDAEGSDLFLTVDDGDMPPQDWNGGACTAEEVAALRAWIEGGAPVSVATEPEPIVVEEPVPGANPRSPWRTWLGKLHPVAVHFPIGLLLAAVLADLLRKRPAACFCLTLGALGAIAASALGWIAGETTPGTKLEDLDRHRWTGIALSVYAVIAALLYPRLTREDGAPRLAPRLMLVGLVVLVSLAGHWGGQLSWGPDYLTPPW